MLMINLIQFKFVYHRRHVLLIFLAYQTCRAQQLLFQAFCCVDILTN